MKNASLLYPEERRSEILNRVSRAGRVSVVDLSREFGVSPVTIRADLAYLDREARIIRTHGGAVSLGQSPELSLSLRRRQNISEKDRIGAFAATLVMNGEAIFLDTSSTALSLARHLKKHHELTVVTNGLAVAQVLLEAPGVNVVIPGGLLQRDTLSLVGTAGLSLLDGYNLQTGFFGAHGFTLREGLTDVSASVAEFKAALRVRCRQVCAIFDHTKWGAVGLASFAAMDQIHQIITDDGAPAELVEQTRKNGIHVSLV